MMLQRIWNSLICCMSFALCICAAPSNGQETITIRSGNGSPGSSDSNISFLSKGDGAIGPFSAADFNAARNGPKAAIVSHSSAWVSSLPADPLAQWIAVDSNRSPKSALYAYDFQVNTQAIHSASIDLYFAVDNNLGDSSTTGLYVNGTAIASTNQLGGYNQPYHFTVNNIGSLLHPGTNTLYFYQYDYGVIAGSIFSATLTIAGSRNLSCYVITDLGTLGGSQSLAYGLNQNGHVVGGASTTGEASFDAFLWNGAMTDLGTLGGTYGAAYSINDSNQITGEAENTSGYRHAVLWSNGQMIDLGTLGGSSSIGFSINRSGNIVGNAHTSTEDGHPFLYSNGLIQDLLPSLQGTAGTAYEINDQNQIVGYTTRSSGYDVAFRYDLTTATFTDIGTLPGYLNSQAFAVNASGTVVGRSYNDPTAADSHAFFYDGTLIDLNTLGGAYAYATGINSSGAVVGAAQDSNGDYRAFLWQNSVMTDLNTLIPSTSGWTLTEAHAINDHGQIVGSGVVGSETHAYLLTPLALSALTLSPAKVVGGSISTGTVTLNGPACMDTTVTLTSGASAATVPLSVTIPAGQISVSFTITTGAVSSPVTCKISATFNAQTVSANLVVNPIKTKLAISFSPRIQPPNTGYLRGTTITITVTLTDSSGNPLGNQLVSVILDIRSTGQKSLLCSGTTDAKGHISCQYMVPTDTSKSSIYVEPSFSGNKPYQSSSASRQIPIE